MEVLELQTISLDTLLGTLRQTRLIGHAQFKIYGDASLELVRHVETDLLTPAQRYVLTPNIERTVALRAALLPCAVDIFDLSGAMMIRTDETPDEWIPVLPPIIEESVESVGKTVLLINDGMHRTYAARSLGLPISIIAARGVPAEYPYYAYALPNGWSDVEVLDELPEVHEKKSYRQPDNYKALFRDFNALFPGVQKQRPRSNPGHLAA